MDLPDRLPGVQCEACGETWGGSGVLPFVCPEEYRGRKEWRSGPVSAREHRALREQLAAAMRRDGCPVEADALRPGSELQPGYLSVPSRPRADFLWRGLGSIVVSARVRDAFLAANLKGAVFVPTIIRRAGALDPEERPPVPSSGEPEDMFDEVPLLPDPQVVVPYYELVVQGESGLPHGIETPTRCSQCGRESFDRWQVDLRMYPDMWRGDDVFFLRTTLRIVVLSSVKRLIESAGFTNVSFKPAGPVPLLQVARSTHA